MTRPGARRLTDLHAPWGQPLRWPVPDRFNMARACCDDWADTAPDRVAVIAHRGRRWSYGALRHASVAFAEALRDRGIGPGDRVALLLPQGAAVLIAHLACYRLGAIALPLFTLFGPDALRFRLADSGARAAVTDAANLPKLQGLSRDCPDLRVIWCSGDAGGGDALPFAAASCATTGDIFCADTTADDPAVMIYTSGTTGPPKGALLPHRALIGHLPAMEVSHPGLPAPGDIGWTPADWAWIGGLMDMALPCLFYGVPLIAHRLPRFAASEAYELIRRTGANRLFLPPTALKLMAQCPAPAGMAVRSVASGGESLGADLVDWTRAALGAELNEIYGQTECNLVVASSRAHGVSRAGAMGRAVPGHDVAIIDPAGRKLPAGELGEIAVRAPDPVMFLRYWNQPEKTRSKFAGPWLKTGDLGRMDSDGYVTFVARDDDVITSSGYRIGPSEIENCLTADPAVTMAAVVGHPDPVRTEAVVAFLVPAPGAGPDAAVEARLANRVRDALGAHLTPRAFYWQDSLPMTATGKIMRRELRQKPPTAT